MPKSARLQPPVALGVTEIEAMSGRTVRWVQNLAKDQGIEKDGRGKYRLGSLIRGLIAHYEEIIERGSKSAASSRVTDARTREIELRIAQQERSLIPVEDAIAAIDLTCGIVNEQLGSLPARFTRDLKLRRQVEAEVVAIRQRIASAVRDARILAETGRHPADPDQNPRETR